MAAFNPKFGLGARAVLFNRFVKATSLKNIQLQPLKAMSSLKVQDVQPRPLPEPWNYLWKPGPYPLTKEAREAAARKYGLIPEDYEPYPDDGDGNGDYPKLTPSSGDSRSGHIDWDIPDEKRNFCEPLHIDWDMYTETAYDVTTRPRYTYWQYLMMFIGCVSIFAVPMLMCDYMGYHYFPAIAEEPLFFQPNQKQKRYYSFEIIKED